MSDVPHLLLVGARPEVVGKLVGLPVAVTVIQMPGRDTTTERLVAREVISLDFTNLSALITRARQIHRLRRIDAVLSLTEAGLHPASLAAQAVGARANPPEAVATTVDKAAMRRRLAEKGVGTTAYQLCRDPAELARFVARCPDGTIVKPLNGSGSEGIALARRPEDVPAAWQWCAAATAGGPALAEEYLRGREFSAETVTADGVHRLLAVTAKHTTGPPHFIETGHDLPARLARHEREAVCATVFSALDAVGHTWGPGHTELIAGDGRMSIVEINTRVGGDRIWEMVELATGTDLVGASVAALAFGAPEFATGLAVGAGRQGGASVRFLTPPAGRVRAVSGADSALSVDGVVRVGDLPGEGQVIQPLTSSDHRAGYVLAIGRDVESAARSADEAAGRIAIRTAPLS
jgi:biotin carboxylase